MFCNWQQDRGRYVCQNCGAKRRKQVRRVCPGKSKKRVRRAKTRPIATTGLGDVLESAFRRVGIKAAVTWITAKTGSNCDCEKRRDTLNKLVPFCRDRACWRLAVSHWKFYLGPKLQALQGHWITAHRKRR